ARVARVHVAAAGPAAVRPVAEHTVVARRPIGHELADAAADVVAGVVRRAAVAIEARFTLPDQPTIELATAQTDVRGHRGRTIGPGSARGGRRVPVAEEPAGGVALLILIENAVAALRRHGRSHGPDHDCARYNDTEPTSA